MPSSFNPARLVSGAGPARSARDRNLRAFVGKGTATARLDAPPVSAGDQRDLARKTSVSLQLFPQIRVLIHPAFACQVHILEADLANASG